MCFFFLNSDVSHEMSLDIMKNGIHDDSTFIRLFTVEKGSRLLLYNVQLIL